VKSSKWLAMFLAVVMGGSVLAGCGGSTSKPADTTPMPAAVEPKKEEQVTLVWSYWGDPWEVELNTKVKAAFEAKYPNIKIQTQHDPWANYFDKVQTQWAGGNSPDVMFLTNIPLYSSKGVLMDLNPMIQKNKFDLSDYPEDLLLPWKSQDGKLWGTPRDNDTKVIFYNKKMFDEAKLPYPTKDWTWDDLRRISQKLTKREGSTTTQFGFAFETAFWRLFAWQNGGAIFDNDRNPTKVELDSPATIQAVQFLSDLINKDKVTPPYDQLKGSSTIASLFQSGKVGLAWGNAAMIPTFSKITDFTWDVVPMPKAANDKPFVGFLGGAGYTVAAKTKHPDAAFTFWSYLSSQEAQNIFASSGLIVPATKSGQKSDAFAKDKPYNVENFVYSTSTGKTNPPWTYWPGANRTINDEVQKALVGQVDAAIAVKSAAKALGEYLKDPK
jgi:multiple sugar transport system substrate-binding protein